MGVHAIDANDNPYFFPDAVNYSLEENSTVVHVYASDGADGEGAVTEIACILNASFVEKYKENAAPVICEPKFHFKGTTPQEVAEEIWKMLRKIKMMHGPLKFE